MFLIYLKKLFKFSGAKIYIYTVLAFFLGLIQGISIFMLIPLLSMAGIINRSSIPDNALLQYLISLFSHYSLPIRLIIVLLIYILIISLHSISEKYKSITGTEIQQGFSAHLRKEVHALLIYVDWSYILKKRLSDFNHILTIEITRVGGATKSLLDLITTIIIIFVHICIAFFLSVPLTLLVLVCGLFMFLFMYPLSRESKKMGQSISYHTKELFSEINEHMNALKEVKSFNVERKHIKLFNKLSNTIMNNSIIFSKIQSTTGLYYKICAVVMISIFFYFAIILLDNRPEELILLIYVFSRLWPKLSSLQSSLQKIYLIMPAFKHITDTMTQCLENNEGIAISNSNKDIKFIKKIELKNVFFQYDIKQNKSILNNINLTIPAYKTTAIVGPSGAGKSTLIDIIMGLLKPQKGTIIIDDSSHLDINTLSSWRQQIAYVPQSPFLFNGSIRDNLSWVNEKASDKEMWEVLNLSAANDFVRDLPEQLDTIIGDKGIRLSGGERQRIVLARALLRKPSLLILDESTNSLDIHNEQYIKQALDKLHNQLTIVIITHRLWSVKSADEIYVINNGEIVEQGVYSDLIKKSNGYFQTDFSKIL